MADVRVPENIRPVLRRLAEEEGRVRSTRDKERENWQQREAQFADALRQVEANRTAAIQVAAAILQLPPGSSWNTERGVFEVPDGAYDKELDTALDTALGPDSAPAPDVGPPADPDPPTDSAPDAPDSAASPAGS